MHGLQAVGGQSTAVRTITEELIDVRSGLRELESKLTGLSSRSGLLSNKIAESNTPQPPDSSALTCVVSDIRQLLKTIHCVTDDLQRIA